ncbi:putative transporter svop-1 [Bolinopsis microptera]|uniref:putative transporter svop-1 n=1 Tax=Bolinopsis microptera TaxID=2820187 RepID=UPI003079DD16
MAEGGPHAVVPTNLELIRLRQRRGTQAFESEETPSPDVGAAPAGVSPLETLRERSGVSTPVSEETQYFSSAAANSPHTVLQRAAIRNLYTTPPETPPQPPQGTAIRESRPFEEVETPPPSSPPQPPPPNPYKKVIDDEEMFEVNTVIEKTGWGWYQYKVVFVMGIMSFADAAEVWLATIILQNLKCEWNLTSLEKALIPAIVYFFYAIGSIISGKLADKFGRFPVMIVNGYLLVLSAVASAFAPSYYFFLCCRGVTGFCIGGSYGCSVVYSAEMVPAKKRSWNMCILEFFWTVGSVYECVIAFWVMDLEGGWRYQILLTAVPCAIMLFLLHFMDESPRYLVIHGEREKAMRVIEKICQQNQAEVPAGTLYCSDVRSGEYGEIWTKPHTSGSIQITIHYICNMFLVFGITMLVVDMMADNYCYMEAFFETTYINAWGCKVYTKAEYLFLIVVALAFVPGFILGTVGAETVGRRWTFISAIYLGAAFTVLLLICMNAVLTYVEVFGAIVCYSAYNEVLWIYAPEFYPTYMRGTAVGVQNGIGKLGAAAGTFLTEYLDDYDIKYSLYCFVVVQAVACLTILFMKRETRGEQLIDTRVNELTYINEQHQS